MQIFINDKATTCPAGSSLTDLLQQQELPAVNIAIAIDNQVIPKSQWATTQVKEGSKILIIKAVQGG